MISTNKLKSERDYFLFPEDLMDFFSSPTFKDLKDRLINEYRTMVVDIDYYTNSGSMQTTDFSSPYSFLYPLIVEFGFEEIRIDEIGENVPNRLFSSLPVSKMVFNPSVKHIPDCFLNGNNSIKTIVLSEGLLSIGDEAFCHCRGLQSMFIPSTVEHIGFSICGQCMFLKNIEVDMHNGTYSSLNSNIIVEKETMKVIQGCSSSTIPEGIKCIAYRAFNGQVLLKGINFPESLSSIENEAFYGCLNMTKPSIHPNVKLGNNIF